MMNPSKSLRVNLFYGDILVYERCPFSLWMAFGKYYRELIEKEAIKTIPTTEQYKQLFMDFVKNIG